jgi:hypothetical protein
MDFAADRFFKCSYPNIEINLPYAESNIVNCPDFNKNLIFYTTNHVPLNKVNSIIHVRVTTQPIQLSIYHDIRSIFLYIVYVKEFTIAVE